jgi:predicted amidophosphoribosyltransferase
MEIILFVIMLLGTLAVLAYPLLRPAGAAASVQFGAAGACPQCGRALSGDEAFCPGCGAPATAPAGALRCAHCGRELDGDEAFCPRCGKRVQEAAQ